MKKILLFSSICKPVNVLKVALPSWLNQDYTGTIDYLFYDDNDSEESSLYLKNLSGGSTASIKIAQNWVENKLFYRDHYWSHSSVIRLSQIKNKALQFAVDENYDSIFLVDADLVLNPKTLLHLDGLNKDFVFEIFWTVFIDMLFAKPNCWDFHGWNYKNADSLLKLKEKGTYKVGAGGACTLLSKHAINKGVNFSVIENAGFFGEDRQICTRAEVLGIDIFVDTHYPAYHVFKTKMCSEAAQWLKAGAEPSFFDNWLNDEWKNNVLKLFDVQKSEEKLSGLAKYKMAVYRAKRAFIKSLRE